MMDWDGISMSAFLPWADPEELAPDKVKTSCFPGATWFISGHQNDSYFESSGLKIVVQK